MLTRFRHLVVALMPVMLWAALPAAGAGLPDTGQAECYNDTTSDGPSTAARDSVAADSGTHPRQDCRFGRDAAYAAGALAKAGSGNRGLDYTKIANNGRALAAGAALGAGADDWACTRDNVTGLMWEVKTAAITDLRFTGHSYTWFNVDGTVNGGNAGLIGADTCSATLPDGACNTRAFVAAVNAAALCNLNDWRLPTRRELATLIVADGSRHTIDQTYFPNTNAIYWTGSTYASDPSHAWWVEFIEGKSGGDAKASTLFVRLVRGSAF